MKRDIGPGTRQERTMEYNHHSAVFNVSQGRFMIKRHLMIPDYVQFGNDRCRGNLADAKTCVSF